MLESANSFFSIPLSELSLFDVTMVVLFILALVLTIIFSLILISSKLRRIDSDIKDTSNTQISNNRAILNYLDLISEQLSTKPQSNPVKNSDVRNMEQNISKVAGDTFDAEEELESNTVINQEEVPSINQEKTIAIINNKKDIDIKKFANKELAQHQESISSISEEMLNNKHAQQEHHLYDQKPASNELQQKLEEKQYGYNQNTNNVLNLQNHNIQEVITQGNNNTLAGEQLHNNNNANDNSQSNNATLQEQQLHNFAVKSSNNLENTNNLVKELEQSNVRAINNNLQLPKLSLQVVENSNVSPQDNDSYPALGSGYQNNLQLQSANKSINQNSLNEKESFAFNKNLLDGRQLDRKVTSTQPIEFTQHNKINNSQLFRKYPNLSRQSLGNPQGENNSTIVEEGRSSIIPNQSSIKHNNFSLLQKAQQTASTNFHTPNMDKSEEFANRIKKSALPKHLDNNKELEAQKPVMSQNFNSASRLRDVATYKLPKNLGNSKEENSFSRFSPQPNVLNRTLRLNPSLSSNRDEPAQRISSFSSKSNQSSLFGAENSSPFARPSLKVINNPSRVSNTQNELRSTPSRLKTSSRALYANTTKDRSLVSSFSRIKDTGTSKRPTLGSRMQNSNRLLKSNATGTRTTGVDKNRPIGRIVEVARKNDSASSNRETSRNRDVNRISSISRVERPIERTRMSNKDNNRVNRRSDNKDRSLSSSRR